MNPAALRGAPLIAALALAAPLAAQSEARKPGSRAPAKTSTTTLAGIPGSRAFEHRETIWQGFHEASGYGMVELRPMLLAESPELRLNAMFVFEGTRLTAPPRWVSIALSSRAPRPRFAAAPVLTVLLDGAAPLRFRMFRQARDSAGTAIELLAHKMGALSFLKIANARTVTLRVGDVEQPLTAAQLEALRDFASRMAPAVHARAVASASADAETQGYRLWKDAYEANEVDTAAVPHLVGALMAPEGVAVTPGRRVLVSFVVDSAGRPEVATLRAKMPEQDAAFLDALREALATWEFAPAWKDGRSVRQVVHQAVTFVPRR